LLLLLLLPAAQMRDRGATKQLSQVGSKSRRFLSFAMAQIR
jgi:hypothetical protein